ncbi:HAD family phosphatase [Gillisia sp. M10.2A]|uniref:HAD family phosphatase n=1 Tax=Gillisia lutea TaxID=2909668 RepID=A0ABS9EGM1_9FLAO|nr:HAD family phosphatase [Gillisia lutea]MCF4100920.1 HAD family phosphatase [Gillisia lutea]
MTKIKTLIFDFGDVFVNLDKVATLRAMQDLEISQLSEELLLHNLEYEKGLISSKNFLSKYTSSFSKVNEHQIVTAWNSILIDFPKYRFDFLKKLSEEKKYKLILLSNTNEIHIDWIKENVPFFEEFKTCFDAFYLSHEINLRKPDAEIYEFVLNKHHLKPEECLFIDDTKENTNAAEKLGIKTWNIHPKHEDVIDLFTVKKQMF